MSANRVLVADSAQSAVETIFSKSASMASSGLERKHCPTLSYCFFNYIQNVRHWREQTDLYSHLHTQRSPSAVSAPLPPAQALPVAPGCSACSSTLQGSADRLRSSANTSGQNTAFCFCLRSNGLEIVMEINVAELVTLHSIIVFVNLCRHGKASNQKYIF